MEDKRPQALTYSGTCRKRLQRRKERGQTGPTFVTVRELPPIIKIPSMGRGLPCSVSSGGLEQEVQDDRDAEAARLG